LVSILTFIFARPFPNFRKSFSRYVFGGYGGGSRTGRLDDFYSFDFETGTWEEVKVLSQEKPGCRENNGVVISENEKSSSSIYLFAGYDGQSWLNDLWKFDIETKRWTCIQESTDSFVGHPIREDGGAGGGDPQQILAEQGAGSTRQVRGKIPSRRFGYVSVVHEGMFDFL